MPNMESFYGGRQGASFVIVKKFDAIFLDHSNPEKKYWKLKEYAYEQINSEDRYILQPYEEEGKTKYRFIERNENNYNNEHYLWKWTELDGKEVLTTEYTIDGITYSTKELDRIEQEDMVSCFQKGGESTNEVNYGEYVIIDTIAGKGEYSNPDNGKIFRRGFEYNVSPWYGAEYIGQIVGPTSDAPDFSIKNFNEVPDTQRKETFYTEASGDLIPGYIEDTSTYNNKITYRYATVRDDLNNVIEYAIGFQTPYLFEDFEANSITPYDENYRRGSGTEQDPYYYVNLISQDENEYNIYTQLESGAEYDSEIKYYTYDESTDIYTEDTEVTAENFETKITSGLYIVTGHKWKHPFYQKWQIKIPHGIHGTNVDQIEIVHTKTMTRTMVEKFDTKLPTDGIPLYINEPEDPENPPTPNAYISNYTEEYDILRELEKEEEDPDKDKIYPANYKNIDPDHYYDFDSNYCKIIKEGNIYFINKEYCYMDKIRSREVIHDKDENGQYKFHYLQGKYKNVQRIDLNKNGQMNVTYTDQGTETLQTTLRWLYIPSEQGIDNTKPIDIGNDGTVTVTYNTNLNNSNQQDTTVFSKLVKWVKNIEIDTNEGEGYPLFNRNLEYNIGDRVRYTENGETTDVIKLYEFITNHVAGEPWSNNEVKLINEIEGEGTQKLYIAWNNEEDTIHTIGEPINYIIESVIANDPKFYQHLLIRYSDPEYRKLAGGTRIIDPDTGKITYEKWVTYPSEKLGEDYDEWVDLGRVRGEIGGLHLLTTVDSMTDSKIHDSTTDKDIPPELVLDHSNPNPNQAGWSVAYTHDDITEILYYDYDSNSGEWKSMGGISDSLIEPTKVIIKADSEFNYPETEVIISDNPKLLGLYEQDNQRPGQYKSTEDTEPVNVYRAYIKEDNNDIVYTKGKPVLESNVTVYTIVDMKATESQSVITAIDENKITLDNDNTKIYSRSTTEDKYIKEKSYYECTFKREPNDDIKRTLNINGIWLATEKVVFAN